MGVALALVKAGYGPTARPLRGVGREGGYERAAGNGREGGGGPRTLQGGCGRTVEGVPGQKPQDSEGEHGQEHPHGSRVPWGTGPRPTSGRPVAPAARPRSCGRVTRSMSSGKAVVEEDLTDLSKADLYTKAAAATVPDRSNLNRDDLVKALSPA